MKEHKRKIFDRWVLSRGAALFLLASLQACAPYRVYRAPLSQPFPPQPSSPAPGVAPSPSPLEPESRPVLEQSQIKEEDLGAGLTVAPEPRAGEEGAPVAPSRETPLVLGRETPPPETPPPAREAPPAPPAPAPKESLIAMITPSTPPRRAVSLRLTEEGRKLLEAGDYPKALARLEKTIRIDSSNPYGYYYLAQTHHHMGRFQESLNFLDVAESLFAGQSYWLAEVFALKGENFRALGFLQRADSSYTQALKLNPDNRTATEGLNQVRTQTKSPAPAR